MKGKKVVDIGAGKFYSVSRQPQYLPVNFN